jgi:hypothetical protein
MNANSNSKVINDQALQKQMKEIESNIEETKKAMAGADSSNDDEDDYDEEEEED